MPAEGGGPGSWHALKILPLRVYILGCQSKEYGLVMGLSEPVERGMVEATERLRVLLEQLLQEEVAPA